MLKDCKRVLLQGNVSSGKCWFWRFCFVSQRLYSFVFTEKIQFLKVDYLL